MKFCKQPVIFYVLFASVFFLVGCTIETENNPPPETQSGRDIVLNEVYIIPPDRFYTYSWIELYNPMNYAVTLNGRLRDRESGVDTIIQTGLLMNVERRYVSLENNDYILRVDSGSIWLPVTTGSLDTTIPSKKFLVITNNKNRFDSHFRLGPFDPILVNVPFSILSYNDFLQILYPDSLHKWYPLSRGKVILQRFVISSLGYLIYADVAPPWYRAVSSGWDDPPVSSLIVSDSNVFVGTFGGGVMRSQDNGQTWIAVNTGLTHKNVFSMYSDGTNIYAGTKGGLFVSTDGGNSWSNIANATLNSLIIWAITSNSANLFVGTNNGVYRSTDNGTSWVKGDSGLSNSDVRSLAIIGSTLLAGTNGDGVFLSTNNGRNWVSTAGMGSFRVNTLFVDSTRLFAGVSNAVFRSLDSGKTWSNISSGLGTSQDPAPPVLSFLRSGSRIYIGTGWKGIWFTTNNGNSWTPTNFDGLPFTFLEVRSLALSGTRLLVGTKSNFFILGEGGVVGVFKFATVTVDEVRFGNYGANSLGEVPEFKSVARYVGYYNTGNSADAFYIADDPLPGWFSQRYKR